MIKLDQRSYGKVGGPLRQVDINTLFAESVVREKIPGQVYVDDTERPEVFYIVHPYGMSLLFGNTEKEHFNRALREYLLDGNQSRIADEWLQVYPEAWSRQIRRILGPHLMSNAREHEPKDCSDPGIPCVAVHERVNFTFDRRRYSEIPVPAAIAEVDIVKTTKDMFQRMPGSVVPKRFWRDATAFELDGLGYSAICNGELASTAFSAYRNERKLEIGIETAENYRGNGLALRACRALIDDCLSCGLEPVWACRRGNEGSYRLAQSLGFVPFRTLPYYRLPARG